MARMSELDAALTALLEHTQGVQESVRSIRRLMSGDTAPDPDEEPQPAETGGAVKPAETDTVYTLEQMRAVLYEKTSAGFRDEVKTLLKAHGADRLPDIDPKEYPAMMKEAEAIGA